jgi:holo-[acyl-carrier protein] synthase
VLQSALERKFLRQLRPLTWSMTIEEVVAATSGAEPPGPAVSPAVTSVKPGLHAPASGPFGGRTRVVPPGLSLGHGVDIQEIAALPATGGDFAEAFFQQHFTAAEIAGGARRTDARTHLCGLWCAKEAVRKSDPALAALTPAEIVIEHDPDGRPRVRLMREDLNLQFQITLSISHSAAYAVASVITLRR